MLRNSHYWQLYKSLTGLQRFAVIFLIFNGIYYWPLSIQAGFGPQHFILLLLMIIIGVCCNFCLSKALIIGSIYFLWQIVIALTLNETVRWTTILFSFGLVFTYVGFYNLVYFKKIFTIDIFIELLKFMMLLAFIVCILQQIAIVSGFKSLEIINLIMTYTKKGALACNSLYQEMSTFARFMLVCYYGYVKCSEIRRGNGRYSLGELFRSPHRGVTLRFLWMMLTMGSGTAMIGLLAFSLYFITRKNVIVLIPLFIFLYGQLEYIENKQLQRSLRALNATSTLNREQIIAADGSAASRITPIVNSLNVDFTKQETWFGHGVDYGRNNNLVIRMNATLFDDYGVVFFFLGYIFSFSCAYKINDLGALFMILGLGGGCTGNIHYAWELAMIMTVVRYFIEQDNAKRTSQQQYWHV